MLYKTYIHPHLEYCVPIWNPYLALDGNSVLSLFCLALNYRTVYKIPK